MNAFVDRGQLGPFANAYWGHPAYKLPPEANLLAVAHYLEALDWQREFSRLHAILGGKNPHLQSFLVGGMATPVDPNQQASINTGTISGLRVLIAKARDFVSRVYIPDVLAIASFYKDWAGHGGGVGNYLVHGDYPLDDSENPALYYPAGVITGKNLGAVEPLDPAEDRRVRHPLLVRLRRRRPEGAPPVGGRDEAALHRPQAALRAPGDRQQVQLAQVAPLRRTSRWRSGRWRGCSSPMPRATSRSNRSSTSC